LFQCLALFDAQFRRNGDWIVQRHPRSLCRFTIMTRFTALCGESQKCFGASQQPLSGSADAVSYNSVCADIQAGPKGPMTSIAAEQNAAAGEFIGGG
jgi:hypothetical protein